MSPIEKAVLEYVTTVDGLYGHYLDATAGFVENARRIERSQRQPTPGLAPRTRLDDLPFLYGRGNPNNADSLALHRTTQGEYKKRNRKGGHNHMRAAQLLVVLIYEYWESEHRAKVATSLSLTSPQDLKVACLGDLRLLRHDIIHHRSIVTDRTVNGLEVLDGFEPGQELSLDDRDVERLIQRLKPAMDELVVDAGKPDPEHRKVWRVQ